MVIMLFLFIICNISFPFWINNWNSLSIFNPIITYNKWIVFNWFGIATITILLNIILLPYAIVYWVCKLFTIGRNGEVK